MRGSYLMLGLLALVLSACGGHGSSTPTGPSTGPKTVTVKNSEGPTNGSAVREFGDRQ